MSTRLLPFLHATASMAGRAQSALKGGWGRTLVIVGLLGYALVVANWFEPAASGSDFSGYLSSGKLLASGRLTTTLRTIPEYRPASHWPYTPLAFLGEDQSLELRPTYPPGYPLHLALAGRLAGWRVGPTLLAALTACACIVLCYATLRSLDVSQSGALAGAVALAVSPLLLFVSSVPFSDALGTAWCAVALLAALRARGRLLPGLVCGFAVAVAILVRPTNVLLIPSLAILLWPARSFLGAIFGGLPGAGLAAAYNAHLFGSPLQTGYGSVETFFRWENLGPSLTNYGTTLCFALPAAFLALLLIPTLPWRTQSRTLVSLLVWCAALFGVYGFYEYTGQVWWYLRFVLPCFIALLALALIGVDRVRDRLIQVGRRKLAASLAWLVAVVSVAASVYGMKAHRVTSVGRDQAEVVAICEWTKQNLPGNALIGCFELSGAYYFYTDFPILRLDLISVEDFQSLEQELATTGRPLYAAMVDFAEGKTIERLPGKWERIASFRLTSVWRYQPGTPQLSTSQSGRGALD